MDPYLERPGIWETFHGTLAIAIMAALNRQIRPKYIAQIDLQLYLHERSAAERRSAWPDVAVSKRGARGVALLVEQPHEPPAIVRLPAVEVRKQRVVKIFDKIGGKLITAIGVLSPANKNPKDGFEQYCFKREQYRAGYVNLVEIDLLRRGKRMPVDEPLPRAPYVVFVCRSERRDSAEVWPIQLRDRLPVIPIPLADDDPDARLDLQALRDRAFEEAGWLAEDLYQWRLSPPLRGDDSAWVEQVLARAKVKPTARRHSNN
jgi:hypothetical protein